MQPWWMPAPGPPTKRALVKSEGKKKNLYQHRAYAWLGPLKDCLIKWVSGWVLGPPSAPCCHWHTALCGLSAEGVDRIWYRVTRNDGLTLWWYISSQHSLLGPRVPFLRLLSSSDFVVGDAELSYSLCVCLCVLEGKGSNQQRQQGLLKSEDQ